MNGSPQTTSAFPMDYPDRINIFFKTGLEIIGNQFFDIPGVKGVKVKSAVNFKSDRFQVFCHNSYQYSIPTTAPVIQVAMVPAIIDFSPRETISVKPLFRLWAVQVAVAFKPFPSLPSW